VVRPRSCRVIYYFDTPVLGIRHQLFDRVTILDEKFAYKRGREQQLMRRTKQQRQGTKNTFVSQGIPYF